MCEKNTELRTFLYSEAEGDNFGEIDGYLYKPPVGTIFRWKPFNMDPRRYRVVSVEEDLLVVPPGDEMTVDYIKVVVHCEPV